jgi:hypothetical protein
VSAAAVRSFIDAFNDEDLEALVAALDPDVEIQTARGIVIGRDEVRRWATRNPAGHLRQRLVLDDVRDEGRHVIAFVRRQWFWRDPEHAHTGPARGDPTESVERDGGGPDEPTARGPADETKLAIVATMRNGLIVRWQPFDDPRDALRAAGLQA